MRGSGIDVGMQRFSAVEVCIAEVGVCIAEVGREVVVLCSRHFSFRG